MAAGLFATSRVVCREVALPVTLPALLLAECLLGGAGRPGPRTLHIVAGDGLCRRLQRRTALHPWLVQAAVGGDPCEPRRSTELGHDLLRDAAGLLRAQAARAAPVRPASSPMNGRCLMVHARRYSRD